MTAGPFDQFVDATMDDILANPAKFGAPTFEQFKQKRDEYMKPHDWLGAIDKSSEILKRGKKLKRQYYRLQGYKMKTLEEVQRTAIEMGIDPGRLVPRPQIRDIGGQWCDLEVILELPEWKDEGVILAK